VEISNRDIVDVSYEMSAVLVVCVFLQRNFCCVAELATTETLVSSFTFIGSRFLNTLQKDLGLIKAGIMSMSWTY
jgi:hypothetical protein